MTATGARDPMPCARCGRPHAKCIGHRRDAEPCGQPRMRGQLVCRMHGGSKPAAIANAERRLAEAEARQLVNRLLHDSSAPQVDDPLLELRRIVGRIGNAAEFLGGRVNELDRIDYADANAVRRLNVTVEAWRDLTVEYRRSLTDMVRLGIEDRIVRVTEQQAAQLALAIRTILDRLILTNEQEARVPVVVPTVLRELTARGELT